MRPFVLLLPAASSPRDTAPQVLGSAITVFNEVCPERLELLHPHYRKLCQVLPDVDEWGQIAIMGTLLRYARTQFLNPKAESTEAKRGRKASSDDSDEGVCACVPAAGTLCLDS